MLTHQQILQFRTFGFVALRGLLDAREVATPRQEVTGALADAFGAAGADRDDLGGISGDYLPLAVDRAPLSQGLIADDPRLFQGSAELLGGPTVPTIGIATRFTADSNWHTLQGPDVGGVAFVADLEPRAADAGALRVVPGSHLDGFARRLCTYRGEDPAISCFGGWPCPHVVVETMPGDVIAFDVHLVNCSQGGIPRLAWTIEYLPWPGLRDRDRLRTVRELVLGTVEFDHEDYDRDRWPVWRDWEAGAAKAASRGVAVERLRLLGVLTGGT